MIYVIVKTNIDPIFYIGKSGSMQSSNLKDAMFFSDKELAKGVSANIPDTAVYAVNVEPVA